MRDSSKTTPTETARLIEPPEGVLRAQARLVEYLGRETYERPMRVASTLRAYGVRVLSTLGDGATEALRTLVYHLDPQVRLAVTEELLTHRDVTAMDSLQNLALNDEDDAVKETARRAVDELREAQRAAAEAEVRPDEPAPDTGEDVPTRETGEDAQETEGGPIVETGEDGVEDMGPEPEPQPAG